jgi:hypothetical protein
VFNPTSPTDVVRAIGRAARAAARGDGEMDEFTRGQLMSAYSASRHVAVELETYETEMRWFVRELAAATEASALPHLVAPASDATDPRAVGEAVCDLLDRLRGDTGEAAIELRRQVHALLARLVGREVDLLEDGLAKR